MTDMLEPREIGVPHVRVDGRLKVLGLARYASEQELEHPAYLHPLQAPVARGRITRVDTADARALPGVLAVLTHENAPRLPDDAKGELRILQSPEVAFRGQFVGGVVAETAEIAGEAAALVRLEYAEQEHDTALRWDHEARYAPQKVNPSYPADTSDGDLEAGLAAAAAQIDETYTTPMEHNNPMEPHTTVAIWDEEDLVLHDSTQGVHSVRKTVAELFGLDPGRVRVLAPYVGGGFGSKGEPHAHVVLAVMAARAVPGRPVKLALLRRQMFPIAGHRTPTIQRLRLGADADGHLTAIAHDVVEHTARIKEFAEQTAVATRGMYASPNRVTTHRLVALDVPAPSWMRAPGECPGMYAAECAMDELAIACGLDPIELRVRNEPERDPESGKPFSSRGLVQCLREGAERFGWVDRDPRPGVRRDGAWLVGTGVASATYPVYRQQASATVHSDGDGYYRVSIGAVDIGTGAWTALTQIAADALGVDAGQVDLRIGDSRLPQASVAGGSSGTTTWGAAIVAASRALRAEHGAQPPAGAEATADTPENPAANDYAMHAYGAHFAQVRVNTDTGEPRVSRMLGVFAAGRIINPATARSQFMGGMTMGLSMALHEASVIDDRFGHVVNADLAEYHVAAHADVPALEVHWIDEHDPHVNPMGSKGIGEIGIVGAAAAVANAVHHATGIRVRDLPITPDKLIAAGR
ncbi:MAG: xdhA [Solirubrobacterales bacterium]|nr:xdhA [Solirubrobacterales bacterium]